MSRSVRVRIAPSPTGSPHVGTAYVAMMNRSFARQRKGSFVLRLEDTDRTRCTDASRAAILEALGWLGLTWDEGPDVGGPHGPYAQSERVAAGVYAPHVERLLAQGDAYRCFCTPERLAEMRAAQQAAKRPVMYDGRCRDLDPGEAERRVAAGEAHVVRLKVPRDGACRFRDRLRKQEIVKPWAEIDDQVLTKSDGWPTYHFAAVVDDHLMGITHVIRAEEWLNSTPKHLLLYERLGWEPPELVHVGLLRNPDRSKISKRKNPTDLLWYKHRGYLPGALLNFLATLGHGHPEGRDLFDLDEFTRVFDLDRLSAAGPVFDLQKLDHLQGMHFRALSPDGMRTAVHAGLDERFDELLPHLAERMAFGTDITWLTDYLFAPAVEPRADELVPKGWEASAASRVLADLEKALTKEAKAGMEWTEAELERVIAGFGEERDLKRKHFYMLVRVAIAGRRRSLPLFSSLAILGRRAVLERLAAARLKLR